MGPCAAENLVLLMSVYCIRNSERDRNEKKGWGGCKNPTLYSRERLGENTKD